MLRMVGWKWRGGAAEGEVQYPAGDMGTQGAGWGVGRMTSAFDKFHWGDCIISKEQEGAASGLNWCKMRAGAADLIVTSHSEVTSPSSEDADKDVLSRDGVSLTSPSSSITFHPPHPTQPSDESWVTGQFSSSS